MKKNFLSISLLFFLSFQSYAQTKCFIAQENGKIVIQEGDCNSRHAPCSTFKIPLALMGFDSGVLTDENSPIWNYQKGYAAYKESWKKPQTPKTWIAQSCVWYSQVLTQKLGLEKFQSYIAKFKYGNQDITGDQNQNNGLTNSWLSSSLKISGHEQLKFLQVLLENKLPVSVKSQQLTRSILFIEELEDGWKLFGKTGSGYVPGKDGTLDRNRKTGWFIGWLQKGNRTIIVVHYIEDEDKIESHAGPRAREVAKEKLLKYILNQHAASN